MLRKTLKKLYYIKMKTRNPIFGALETRLFVLLCNLASRAIASHSRPQGQASGKLPIFFPIFPFSSHISWFSLFLWLICPNCFPPSGYGPEYCTFYHAASYGIILMQSLLESMQKIPTLNAFSKHYTIIRSVQNHVGYRLQSSEFLTLKIPTYVKLDCTKYQI